MKNFKTFFTIIAIGAVFGFMVAACKTDTDDPAGGGNTLEGTWVGSSGAGTGQEWTFSGTTFTAKFSGQGVKGTFTEDSSKILTLTQTHSSTNNGSTWTATNPTKVFATLSYSFSGSKLILTRVSDNSATTYTRK